MVYYEGHNRGSHKWLAWHAAATISVHTTKPVSPRMLMGEQSEFIPETEEEFRAMFEQEADEE